MTPAVSLEAAKTAKDPEARALVVVRLGMLRFAQDDTFTRVVSDDNVRETRSAPWPR